MPAERQAVGDEPDAVVCVLRRRHVVHRQDDAGDELDAEEKEQDAAGDEPPADARRQRLVEEVRSRRRGSRCARRASRRGAAGDASELHQHLIPLERASILGVARAEARP